MKDAHHVMQDAAVREIPGYQRSEAPAVHVPGPSTRPGTPHDNATQVQRQRGGGTYAAARRIGDKALRKAGMDPGDARAARRQAEASVASLGANLTTVTRIPGNRRERR